MKQITHSHKIIILICINVLFVYFGNRININHAKLISMKNEKYFNLGVISTQINNNLYYKPVEVAEKNRDYYLSTLHTPKLILPNKQDLINEFNFTKIEIKNINTKLDQIIFHKILLFSIVGILILFIIYKIK